MTAFHLTLVPLACTLLSIASLAQQSPLPPGEWCGAAEAPKNLSADITIAEQSEPGERLTISGRVFYPDRTTPAHDVLIYAYHTNAKGVYPREAMKQRMEDGMVTCGVGSRRMDSAIAGSRPSSPAGIPGELSRHTFT